MVLLDDWRFNEDILGYPLQLLWFEGKPIVIARPQNQFAGHLRYGGDAPLFITTLYSDLTSLKKKKIEGGDVQMMLRRLKVFEFTHKWETPRKVRPCAKCFADLLDPVSEASVSTATPGLKRSMAEEAQGAPSSKAPCVMWSVQDVLEYLEGLGLGHLSEAFKTNGVDGNFLLSLSEDDLKNELGCSNLQARKILSRLPAVSA